MILIQQLQIGSNSLKHFEKALQYFNFEERIPEMNHYSHIFRSFSWLLFLEMRNYIDTKNQTENDYLLISVLYLMVRHSFDYYRPKAIPQLSESKQSKAFITTLL
jgi:hypothetical protein